MMRRRSALKSAKGSFPPTSRCAASSTKPSSRALARPKPRRLRANGKSSCAPEKGKGSSSRPRTSPVLFQSALDIEAAVEGVRIAVVLLLLGVGLIGPIGVPHHRTLVVLRIDQRDLVVEIAAFVELQALRHAGTRRRRHAPRVP